ncbi:MAG: YIP1 family protein [Trueperaceae bacterium]
MTTSPSISDMLSQSRTVLTSPSVATFERFEGRGTLRDALIYVAIAAAISGVFGLSEGVGGFLRNVISTLVGFLVFTYLVHWIGKQRGGTGTLDEVAYSFALFWAPLSVIFGVVTLVLLITIIGVFLLPLVALAALALNVYFGYLAVQSSMNLSGGGTTWTVLLLAGLGSFVVNLILAALLS